MSAYLPGEWPTLEVAHSFLQNLARSLEQLGAPWGVDSDSILLAERTSGAYSIALYGKPSGYNIWNFSVVTVPAVRAVAVIHVGDQSYRAPFDAAGTATLKAVPLDAAVAQIAPTLRVALEAPQQL